MTWRFGHVSGGISAGSGVEVSASGTSDDLGPVLDEVLAKGILVYPT